MYSIRVSTPPPLKGKILGCALAITNNILCSIGKFRKGMIGTNKFKKSADLLNGAIKTSNPLKTKRICFI
jgi:hypothetical protein